ncbi:hypothetical protein EGW08_015415 [Elysia chlorotica]|uniref:Uncharacterized protein n=1 Tax=Elysia chlorotica TaxID=188477 RepID=A0A3S1B0D2_ELYCH|nr:hypothetical protein EGW08_015415 [Elysia chlorotica]
MQRLSLALRPNPRCHPAPFAHTLTQIDLERPNILASTVDLIARQIARGKEYPDRLAGATVSCFGDVWPRHSRNRRGPLTVTAGTIRQDGRAGPLLTGPIYYIIVSSGRFWPGRRTALWTPDSDRLRAAGPGLRLPLPTTVFKTKVLRPPICSSFYGDKGNSYGSNLHRDACQSRALTGATKSKLVHCNGTNNAFCSDARVRPQH